MQNNRQTNENSYNKAMASTLKIVFMYLFISLLNLDTNYISYLGMQ